MKTDTLMCKHLRLSKRYHHEYYMRVIRRRITLNTSNMNKVIHNVSRSYAYFMLTNIW